MKKQIIQWSILILTSTSIILVNIDGMHIWAGLIALLAQPFWLYETFMKRQWGMFANTIVITCAWVYGLV